MGISCNMRTCHPFSLNEIYWDRCFILYFLLALFWLVVSTFQLIEPYGTGLDPKKNESTEQKLGLQGSKLEKVEVNVGPTSGFRSMSPDESKEIKNIYIDCKPLFFFFCLSLVTLWKLKFCTISCTVIASFDGRVLLHLMLCQHKYSLLVLVNLIDLTCTESLLLV